MKQFNVIPDNMIRRCFNLAALAWLLCGPYAAAADQTDTKQTKREPIPGSVVKSAPGSTSAFTPKNQTPARPATRKDEGK